MQDILVRLVDVPIARMFVLAAIIFLLVAVLGRIEGKIEPGKIGRIGATVVGMLLMGSGLAMHFIDAEALRNKLNGPSASVALPSSDKSPIDNGWVRQAMASPSETSSTALSNQTGHSSTIKVVAGTYGRNCGAKTGNATSQLVRHCDGQAVCEFAVEPLVLEDAAPECAKDFIAEWKCGAAGTLYAASLPVGEASRLHLSCER